VPGLPLTQATTVNVGKFWQEFGDRDTLTVRENYRAVGASKANSTGSGALPTTRFTAIW